jgi:eukaryotic-like serine/threonine-protein kinase
MSAFTPGLRLHDRYRLEALIGSGGMASVWRATDLVLGRPVAIKEGARREAQAAARLTHPHITAVHDYAEVTLGGQVIPYLVLELLSGQTLAERLRQGAIPWPEAATIAGQVASALAYAHQHGVVHQDIKPANIMLTPSGVKVLDFGIASMHGHAASPDWISGTPAYAAPERLRSGAADPSADVFSLGVVTYEMATGHLPWPIETWEQAASVERVPPAPMPHGVPAPQILAALALDPAERPSAAALAATFGSGSPTLPTPLVAAVAAATSTTAVPKPTLIARAGPGPISASARVPEHPTRMYEAVSAPPRRRGRGSPGVAAALALIVLLLTLGAIFLAAALMQQRPGGKVNPTTNPTPPVTSRPAPTSTAPNNAAAVNELLNTLREWIRTSVQTGQIDGDVGRDLQGRLDDIADRWQRGRINDVQNKVQDLRERIQNRAKDGKISQPVAATLDALLRQLADAAR